MKDGSPPFIEGSVEAVLFPGYSPEELFVYGTVPGINAPVTDHFEMFFRDMADETFYELQDRYGLFHIGIIFMAVVMESDVFSVIVINAGSGDDRPAEITADILCHRFRVTFVGFCIDIETMFVVPVAGSFYLFKRGAEPAFHFIKESGTEGIPEVIIIEVPYSAPVTIIAVAAFGDQTMDVWIPFEVPAKSVEDHDVTGCEVL